MGLTILLADNSMAVQNLGKKILSEAGYEVVTVSNGVAAGKKIAELHPDIALLDVYMAGYTGVEVCEKTKAAPETARIPVLLTVGKIEPFRAEDGIKVKADGVITKPFEANDLIAVVGRLVGNVNPTEPALATTGVVSSKAGSTPTPPQSAPPELQLANHVIGPVGSSATQPPPRPTAIATPSQSTPPELQVANHAIGPVGSGATQPPPKPAVIAAAPSPQPASKPPRRSSSSDSTVGAPAPRFSREGGEICDVCGHLNPEHAEVCQQCDVPLPSSLSLHRPKTSRLQ